MSGFVDLSDMDGAEFSRPVEHGAEHGFVNGLPVGHRRLGGWPGVKQHSSFGDGDVVDSAVEFVGVQNVEFVAEDVRTWNEVRV